MQDPIDPAENVLVEELRQLRPVPPSTSILDVWFTAGYCTAKRRARRWHAASVAALVGLSVLIVFRPSPRASVQRVDRVVYVQTPAYLGSQPALQPLSPPPSAALMAAVLENRRQTEDALADKWTLGTSHGSTSSPPILGAWMSDPDSKQPGGL